MKAHVQAIRHLVYQVFDSLLALHRDPLKAMGPDFVNSFTKMVDGEKDPRNLMLLFSMDKVILLEFDIKPHIEVSGGLRAGGGGGLTCRTCLTSLFATFRSHSAHHQTTRMGSPPMTSSWPSGSAWPPRPISPNSRYPSFWRSLPQRRARAW